MDDGGEFGSNRLKFMKWKRAYADGLPRDDHLLSFDGRCFCCVHYLLHVEEEPSLDRNSEVPHWPPRAATYAGAMLGDLFLHQLPHAFGLTLLHLCFYSLHARFFRCSLVV